MVRRKIDVLHARNGDEPNAIRRTEARDEHFSGGRHLAGTPGVDGALIEDEHDQATARDVGVRAVVRRRDRRFSGFPGSGDEVRGHDAARLAVDRQIEIIGRQAPYRPPISVEHADIDAHQVDRRSERRRRRILSGGSSAQRQNRDSRQYSRRVFHRWHGNLIGASSIDSPDAL
jgi:hypothetical protein